MPVKNGSIQDCLRIMQTFYFCQDYMKSFSQNCLSLFSRCQGKRNGKRLWFTVSVFNVYQQDLRHGVRQSDEVMNADLPDRSVLFGEPGTRAQYPWKQLRNSVARACAEDFLRVHFKHRYVLRSCGH